MLKTRSLLYLIFLCLISCTTGNHVSANGCGIYTEPTSACTNPGGTGCICLCADNYTGDATCTATVPYEPDECIEHCSVDVRTAYCNGHGISSCYAQKYYNWTGVAGIFDVAYGCPIDESPFQHYDTDNAEFGTASMCRCDPGWTTYNSEECAHTIRTVLCNGNGRDASGLEAGTGPCDQFPYFHPSCSFGWPAIVPFGSGDDGIYGPYQCSCDPGFWGGFPNKCSTTIRATHCSNHGVDSCSTCRRLSNASNSEITCSCDPESGWATFTTIKTQQCAHFVPCLNYSCGANGACGCATNVFNPNGTCCNCTTGYGGPSCCPLRFGSTSVTCNGLGSCLETGNCQCPPGTQMPGCCLACETPEQPCLPDGRCGCAVINGTKCGTRGSTCNEVTQLCSCSSFEYTSVTANQTWTVQTGGQFCCPRSTANGMLCSGRGTCHAAQHADLIGTGGCVCTNTSYGGAFCCPVAPGQTKACGDNGECMPDGSCMCDPGVGGPLGACEINYNCRTSDTKNECSGGGSCSRMAQGNYGFGDLLQILRYDDHPNTIYICHDNTCNYTDEGLVFFIQDYYKDFLGINLREQDNEGQYYPQNFSACATGMGTGRGQCLWNVLTACHPQRDAFMATFAGALPYVTDFVFPSLHPSRNVNNAPLFLQAAQALISPNPCTSSNTSLAREAQASLITYEVIYRKTGQPISPPGQGQTNLNAITMLPTSLEGYPYQCTCTPPPGNSIIGFQTTPAGVYCQLQCLVGGTTGEVPHLQACSGFIHGQARGYCTDQFGDPKGFGTVEYDPDNPVPVPGICRCNSRFAGSACQYSRSPGCIPLVSTTDTPCTSTQRGTCLQTLDLQQQPTFSCNCSAQFTGTYCELSRCQPPGQSPTETECNNRGVCQLQTGLFQCNCDDYNSGAAQTGSGNIIPFLAGGLACEVNVTAGCGTFRPGLLGGGVWELCSGAGRCVVSYTTPPTAECACDTGRGGVKCRDTACNPTCNARQTCTNSTGTCACKPFWGPPPVGTCGTNNRTCECSVNLCLHGTPDAAGQVCTCNPGWKKVPFGQTGISGGIAGSCDIVQCPLVVHNDQGIRLCNEPSDPRCSDLSSISQSLATGCCVDSCPSCSINATDGSRICNCGAGVGVAACFISTLGACFPKCHGNDLALANPPNCINPGPPPICNCAAVTLASNQFVDATCLRYTCVNGVRFGTSCIPQQQQCCNCAGTAFTGSLCSEANCGGRGIPNANNTACDCYEPFYRGPGRSDCNLDRCTPGTVTGFTPNFQCVCPSTTIIGPGSLSCISLDCAGIHAAQCASCIHGTPAIENFAFKCDCTGTTYTGADCNTAVCQNGGTPQASPNQFNCTCPFPYSGQFCAGNQCLNGGTPVTGQCNCPAAWTGNRCQTAVGSSSTAGPSPSSSSTGGGGGGDTGDPTPTPPSSSSSSGLSTTAIIGIAAGGAVLLLGGCAYAVNRNSSAYDTTTKERAQRARRQQMFEDEDALPGRIQEQIQLLDRDYTYRMRMQQQQLQSPPPSADLLSARLQDQIQLLQRRPAIPPQPPLDITANW